MYIHTYINTYIHTYIYTCNVRAIRYKRILFFYGLPRRVSFRSLRLRLRQCLLWCCVHVCCRAAVWPRICAAAPLSMLPRSYTCCRAPMVPRAAERYVVLVCVAASHGAAQFYVLPRSMLPRSSLCCRVPWCRAVLHVAASHGAVQFYMLPRSMLPRYVLRAAAPRSLVPRSSTCCRAPWCRARHNSSSLRLVAARWSGLL